MSYQHISLTMKSYLDIFNKDSGIGVAVGECSPAISWVVAAILRNSQGNISASRQGIAPPHQFRNIKK